MTNCYQSITPGKCKENLQKKNSKILGLKIKKKKKIDERLGQSIRGEDPNLVVDLRLLNKGQPNDTFKVFFEALEKRFEEIVVADDRRHGIAHLSHFISVCDLTDQVTKLCPVGTAIMGESTVLFAFTPSNAYAKTTKLYNSRFPLKFKVQSRQLCASQHIDDYFCAAQF